VGLGFELGASYLQSRGSAVWAIPPVHFALVILETGISHIICPNWRNHDPPDLSLSSGYDYRHSHQHPALILLLLTLYLVHQWVQFFLQNTSSTNHFLPFSLTRYSPRHHYFIHGSLTTWLPNFFLCFCFSSFMLHSYNSLNDTINQIILLSWFKCFNYIYLSQNPVLFP
jgi:hypothetical protein